MELLIPALQQVPALVLFVFAMIQMLRFTAAKDRYTHETLSKFAEVIRENTKAINNLTEALKK